MNNDQNQSRNQSAEQSVTKSTTQLTTASAGPNDLNNKMEYSVEQHPFIDSEGRIDRNQEMKHLDLEISEKRRRLQEMDIVLKEAEELARNKLIEAEAKERNANVFINRQATPFHSSTSASSFQSQSFQKSPSMSTGGFNNNPSSSHRVLPNIPVQMRPIQEDGSSDTSEAANASAQIAFLVQSMTALTSKLNVLSQQVTNNVTLDTSQQRGVRTLERQPNNFTPSSILKRNNEEGQFSLPFQETRNVEQQVVDDTTMFIDKQHGDAWKTF